MKKTTGRPRADLTGKTFNYLTVEKFSRTYGHSTVYWLCKCVCGKKHEVSRAHLQKNVVKSCGCKRRELQKDAHTVHGMTNTRPFRIWDGIRRRCREVNHRDYPRYGGVGITYDKKWETFLGFWNDMKKGYADDLSIDRIDGTKGYSKENCRWATSAEQALNRKSTRLYKGRSFADISRSLGGSRGLVNSRLSSGWDIDRACTTPAEKRKKAR